MIHKVKKVYAKVLSKKRRLLEIGGAGLFVLIIGLIGASITPYSPSPSYEFYNDSASNQEILRATVETTTDTSLEVRLKDGPSKGNLVTVSYDAAARGIDQSPGSTVLLINTVDTGDLAFLDKYRIPFLLLLTGIFVAVVALIGRKKGLRSLAGLTASVLIIGIILIPMIKAGVDTFIACIIAAALIAFLTIVISHGINKRAFAILVSMGCILLFVALSGWLVVAVLGLSGIVDEATYYIYAMNANINVSGLVTGGIVIATVGALDDIVTTQVAAVYELRETNRKLKDKLLFEKASRIGAEHIASLVNTLAMVYVGAALPMIVTFALGTPDIATLINSELIATEIGRTMVISIALVLAVPLSTWLGVKVSGYQVKGKTTKRI